MATTQQSGFAPAASPLASTIVQTPDDAIVAGFTSIPSQGDNMPAYHARPKQSDGPLPVVIVVQEIFGFATRPLSNVGISAKSFGSPSRK